MNPAKPITSETDLVARAEAEAAVWLGLCDRGLSPEQEVEFAEWLEADPRNPEAYGQFQKTWNVFGGGLDSKPLMQGEPDPDLLAPSHAETQVQSRKRRWPMPLWAGVAAAIAVGIFGWWQLMPRTVVNKAFVTELGAIRTLKLPDGSVVQLNTNSKFEVSFTPEERRVRLDQGEAHFTVAKNPERPFVVMAGPVTVRAVGTAFNVRYAPAEVVVLVTEGKVRVDDSESGGTLLKAPNHASPTTISVEEPLLIAGQRGVFPITKQETPKPSLVSILRAEDMARTLAWREKRLEFASSTLAEAVAEFNRYNRHQLVISDPKLGEQLFGGTFEADGYDTFVRLLERSFGVKAERLSDKTILRAAP